MSMIVRREPLVPRTTSGHGGWRIVPGRSQYRIVPIGGRKRIVSGPKPHPRPSTSNSSVQTITFWNTTGSNHQSFRFPSEPMPGVDAANNSPPRM